jgi:mono/diheme cytochrome c family protein
VKKGLSPLRSRPDRHPHSLPGGRAVTWGAPGVCAGRGNPAAGRATPEAPAGPTGEGDQANGGEIFVQYCASCHGPDAGGGGLGPSLVSAQVAAKDQAYFQETISKGRTGTSMPPWDGLLSPQQIEDVIAFLRSKQ